MAVTIRPFDIMQGKTRYSEVGLLKHVREIHVNRNNDKKTHGRRGKGRVKANHLKIVLANDEGQCDNILRLGRSVTLWMRYQDNPFIRMGKFRIEKPNWDYTEKSADTVALDCAGPEVRLCYEKRPRTWERRTHSEIALEVAAQYGWLRRITPTAERVTRHLAAGETLYDFLEDLAWELGWDFWVDESTEPATLVFEPPDLGEPVTIGERSPIDNRPLTVGCGRNTTATVRAAYMRIARNLPVTSASGKKRTSDGAKVPVTSLGSSGVVGTFSSDEEDVQLRNPGTPDGVANARARNISNAATPRCTLEAGFGPWIPYWRLSQVVPVVEKGDNSGNYRIVDISHDYTSQAGDRSAFKCVLGGGQSKLKGTGPSEGRVPVTSLGSSGVVGTFRPED